MSFEGCVHAIAIATERKEPLRPVDRVRAVQDLGLEGDRYYAVPPRSPAPSSRRHVTLIEMEAIEAAARDYNIDLELGESRRNIVTRGVPLNHLVGEQFYVGEAVFEGVELCEPCAYLEGLTGKKLMKALLHRGGLRAAIVQTGSIRVGDRVHLPA